MRTLAVVSARYESTRFPGKMLHNLMGKPLIDWSIDYCKKAKFFDDIVVATDSNKIKEHINSNFENIKVIKIDGEIRCATERLFRVFELLNSDYYMYISIPADEPFVDPTEIDRLRKEILNENPEHIITLYTDFFSEGDLRSKLSCKIVTDYNNYMKYNSRHIIPATKDGSILPLNKYKKHVGLMFFSNVILEKYGFKLWDKWKSDMADIESLEQNRFVDFGIPVKMFKIKHDFFGIDTEKQIDEITDRYNFLEIRR